MANILALRMIKAFVRLGWTVDHVKGSHHYLVHPGRRMVCIPVHKGATLKQGLARAILRDAGLSEEEFFSVY